MGREVALTQQVHSETAGDLPVLLGHEEIQHLGGQQTQRLSVDELQLTTVEAIHHLKIERETLFTTLGATDLEVITKKLISISDQKNQSRYHYRVCF